MLPPLLRLILQRMFHLPLLVHPQLLKHLNLLLQLQILRVRILLLKIRLFPEEVLLAKETIRQHPQDLQAAKEVTNRIRARITLRQEQKIQVQKQLLKLHRPKHQTLNQEIQEARQKLKKQQLSQLKKAHQSQQQKNPLQKK